MIIPEDPNNRLLAEALDAAWAVTFTDGDPTKAVARIRDVLRGVERDAASIPTDAIELAVLWPQITLDHEPPVDHRCLAGRPRRALRPDRWSPAFRQQMG